MKITIPAGAPPFAASIAREVERGFVSTNPKAPVKLPRFSSTDLPDPARYAGCLVWLTNMGTPAVSNGTSWFPITLGAAL